MATKAKAKESEKETADKDTPDTPEGAPLNPPRLTSYGVVTTEVVTFASRGMLELPNGLPLSVVLF